MTSKKGQEKNTRGPLGLRNGLFYILALVVIQVCDF